MRRAAIVATAVPPVAAALTVALFVLAEVSGSAPLSLGYPRNVAEAAGMGSGAEVLRLLAAGDDPNRVQPVRPEILSTAVRRISAVEAAVWSRRLELVRLLDERGAIIGADRQRLACLATDLGSGDIAEYLAADGTPSCVEDEVRDAIIRRTERAGP